MKFAVIPSNGRTCLEQCVEAIKPQVDEVIVIDTSGKVPPWMPTYIEIVEGPVNISRWWNIGLDVAAHMAEAENDTWDVAVLNDDVIVPEGWFAAVSKGMRDFGCAAACSNGMGYDAVMYEPKAVPLQERLQGFAFILAGEKGLRANEDLHWYFTDDYIDWESRKLGGVISIAGYPVQHLYPNGQVTSEIMEQIAKDAQTFVDIYGSRPW